MTDERQESNKQKFERIRKGLTPTRSKVLDQLLAQRSYAEIGEDMKIEQGTLRKHVSMLLVDFQDLFLDKEGGKNSKLKDLINLVEEYNPKLLSSHELTRSSPYVSRDEIEKLCYQEIEKERGLLRIQAPPKMGKTALLSELINNITKKGHTAVYINLRQTAASDRESLDKFLQWFCIYIAEEQKISIPLDIKEGIDTFEKYWNRLALGNAKIKCKRFFEKHLLDSKLTERDSTLTLGIDDVENIFKEEGIFTDFLMMLRSWFEEAETNPIWRKLRLILTYTEQPQDVNIDISQSPFNVGIGIELEELNENQVKDLFQQYDLDTPVEDEEIVKLIDLVGGHPYLLVVALKHIRQGTKIEKIIRESTSQAGIYSEYLQDRLSFLELLECKYKEDKISPLPLDSLKKIYFSDDNLLQYQHSETISQLNRLGFIKWEKEKECSPIPQCKLYQKYFRNHLLNYNSQSHSI
jgi:AAA-like domain